MRRKSVLYAVAAAVPLLAATGCSGGGDAPNVVLISIDTLRPDRLGCYGHARDTSPTLDGVAAEGLRFTDVTSASPWTLPSHASLLTGRYPSRHGVKGHQNRLQDSIPTLAEVLREHGYATMALVNSHNLSSRYGLNRGFDKYEYLAESEADGSIPNRGPRIVKRALKWLGNRPSGPFFLFLHFYDVHTDFTPEPAYRERFVRPYAGSIDGRTQQLVAVRENELELLEGDVQFLFDMYDAEIRQLDDVLRSFLEFLGEEGLRDNTLLVVTSDHGEEFMEHGSVLHGRTHYEEVIRIPLLLQGPGLPRGQSVDTPSHLIDVTPTILSYVGAAIPPGVDGVDLAPFWNGDESAADRLLFSEADHNNVEPDIRRMVRAPGHKLLFDRLDDTMQLFDLEADPGERNDLRESDPELAKLLMGRLREFMAGEREGEHIEAPSAEVIEQLKALGYY